MSFNIFGTKDKFCGRQFFPMDQGGRAGFWVIQVHYIYCVLYFCYGHVSSTSDHQALDPGGWVLLI